MTSIAPRIKKILAIVEELKEAVRNKGVDVPETALFPELPDYIKQIVTLDFDFTEIITDTFGQITDSQILASISGFTVVGSPIISYTDGLVSSFSDSNYISIPKSDIFVSSDPEYTMEIRFNTGSDITSNIRFLHASKAENVRIYNSVIQGYKFSSSSNLDISTIETNTWYKLKIVRNISDSIRTYSLYSDDGTLLNSLDVTDTAVDWSNTSYGCYIGRDTSSTGYAWTTLTLDINNTYINNTTDGIYWQPSVSIEDLTL